ncbi:hypothetical protein Skr01_02190 [Sphaerisporangium krabiense]|uniref:Squalene cyclase C-terminal domain-containing protein n=1 Tax=Sphaerisporangium krabiense TaxID=763782 RepID=A0A7W8Z7U1_9ACTN|nr:prenyltransferase/squalene oxidase repeat-containing protein [Sphaerisporangium krabiense]MBB5629026.1 hypothetical protein [Sphaerisporangium krabiense]GII60134.1 hypothetical protein Skr01_02190 [Sphaerisporangium krabiense]
MSASDLAPAPCGGEADEQDVAAGAERLIAGLAGRPWGQVGVSVYETGRLVALAPWLTGHAERIAYLIEAQRENGRWGAHDEYDLVPTLSAVEALLGETRRGAPEGLGEYVARSAARGLRALSVRRPPEGAAPDMPARELIVAYLTEAIDRRLRDSGGPEPHLAEAVALPRPDPASVAKLARIRAGLRSGARLPEKLLHALEVGGEAAAGALGVRPEPLGAVGASPAATAAWLGAGTVPEPGHPARRYLEAVAGLHGGPVPCALPITVFERGWVLSTLKRAGVPLCAPEALVASLRAGERAGGVPAGPGLPADADTTSVALYALALLGDPVEPAALWDYKAGEHFVTWRGEEGVSTTVNAHVLDCLHAYLAGRTDAPTRYAGAAGQVAGWLRDRQRADGSWADRWHASPYYATMSCALALDARGDSPEAVRRAIRWTLSTQRADGSWGLWSGTAEETAYAMQTLLLCRAAAAEPARLRACARGRMFLERSCGDGHPPMPAMWHDKDLYAPRAIIWAAVISARHLASRNPEIRHYRRQKGYGRRGAHIRDVPY